MARRLAPETKTLRYMINGLAMVAAPASRRIRKLSFDLFGFVDVVGFAPILEPAAPMACERFRPMDKMPHVCAECRCYREDHAGDTRAVAPWLAIQATSSDNQAARKKKILGDDVLRLRAFAMIASGHHVEVWGWVRGRDAKTEAFHRWTLAGKTPGALEWIDAGIVEVAPELLVQPDR